MNEKQKDGKSWYKNNIDIWTQKRSTLIHKKRSPKGSDYYVTSKNPNANNRNFMSNLILQINLEVI